MAWYLLTRFGLRPRLDRLKDALLLVFAAAFGAMTVSAAVGDRGVEDRQRRAVEDLPVVFTVWWTGDAMGVLVFTPLLLTLPRQWTRATSPARWRPRDCWPPQRGSRCS